MNENQEENLKKGHLLINRLEEIQYSYFNGRPEWTTVQKNDLKLFLAYTYYKYPSPSNEIENNNYEDHNNSEKIFQLYKDEFKKNIGKLYEVLEKEHIEPGHYSNIDVGVTIIHSICKNKCDTCHNFPAKDIHKYILIRLKFIDKCIYIDIKNSRNYSGWDQYLENNDLPEGFMFYPISGLYDGSKTLHQNITPASKTKEHILKCVDYASFGSISAGFITTACGCIFTLAAPITLAASVLFFGGSLFQIYRNIDKLADMYKHKYDLSGSTPWILWTNLAISTLGVLVAPCHALAAVTSEINTTIQSFSRALTIIRKSGCIAQCTLEVFRAALEFIDNDFKITPENVLKLCLELFIVKGTLMSSSYIKDILKLLAESSVWVPIYKTLEQIPYCLGQTVWNSVYFFKSHFAVFVERVTMFLAENLTVNNLLNSWKTIRHVFEGYQKQIAQLNVGDLLWHVVDGIAVDESVKNVLRGKRMVKLLENLSGKNPIRRALVKYSVDRVLQEAMKLQANRDDCVAESTRHGETRTWKVDEEFCKCYGLDRCAMDQYALWAIFEVGMDAAAVMADYEEYASRPENTYDDEMVVNEACRSGWSAKGYTLVAPCGVLDLEMCLRFSEKINPQPHRYTDHKLVQPEPGVSLMFGISAYSINIVFFGIDMINDVPKMSICFFQQNRDSDTPISDHSGFKKLQAA